MFRRRFQRWYWAVAVGGLLLLASCSMQLINSSEPAAESDAQASLAVSGEPGEVEFLPPESPPFSTQNWRTDFSKRIVEWSEILSGGPPKDGIASIDEPVFESVDDADGWLSARDPVIFFEHAGDVRAYPLAILIWHEIVNDQVGGMPVAVTFCPLCNASIVFDATIDGQVHEFGTTGRLRNSDLVMYDRVTESWWQQFTGQALIGEYAGRQLEFLPSQVISFGDFAAEFPEGQVLQRPGAARSYGANPYANYDSTTGSPFLFRGELDTRLATMERVVGLEINGEVMAYGFSDVTEAGAINDEVGGLPLVVFHKAGTASALDQRSISESRDVGSAAVFERQLGDQLLTFSAQGDGTFTDAETGSTWNLLGEAVAGELAGAQLEQVIAFDHFWFAWSAFYPQTEVYGE